MDALTRSTREDLYLPRSFREHVGPVNHYAPRMRGVPLGAHRMPLRVVRENHEYNPDRDAWFRWAKVPATVAIGPTQVIVRQYLV